LLVLLLTYTASLGKRNAAPWSFEFLGIRWEIEGDWGRGCQKQLLKVETVDVTVDRTNFVLYVVYLFDDGPSLKMKSPEL